MEHLPLPGCARAHDQFPCITTRFADDGPFSSFPARQNWEIQLFQQTREEAFLHCGQTPSAYEVDAFLQSWLYFGTLHEVFGGSLTLSDFTATDDEGNRCLYTAKLRQAWRDLLLDNMNGAAAEDVQPAAVTNLCIHTRNHLNDLYRVLAGLQKFTDSATLTVTAILAETLEDFVDSVHLLILRIATPPNILWGTWFSGWIIDKMKSSGWCPSTITRLASERPRISLLHYYSHLPPPQKAMDHSDCTNSSCSALRIKPSLYRTAHTNASCECSELHLSIEDIGRALGQNRLPLISVSPHGDCTTANIQLQDDDGAAAFVAISHVWADGLGNPKNNSLPACSLQEISRLVNQLPRRTLQQNKSVPFWIDTVCVPVGSAAQKQLALNKVRDPYMRADHVLVLDNYLRTVNANDCDALEVFARLLCCNWMSRLWTLQEGRLAKRIWFQFKDKAIEPKALWGDNRPANVSGPNNKGAIHYRMLLVAASKLQLISGIKNFWNFELNHESVPSLRYSVCFRSVSVPVDEALCLFCLAGLDMAKITSVPASPSQRMKVFWAQLQTVPSGLLFSKCPKKLDEPGLRWAPVTFMGALSRNAWAGSPRVELDFNGIPTSDGLLTIFSGFKFSINWYDMHDTGFYFRSAGDWFRVNLEEPWHTTSAFVPSQGPQEVTIILMQPLHGPALRDPDGLLEEPEWPTRSDGVLGIVTDNIAGIKYVKCLRHVDVRIMRPREQFINDVALDCVFAENPYTDFPLDLARAVQLADECFDKYPNVARACQSWLGSSYGTAQALFVARLMALAKPTNHYGGIAEKLMEDQRWCAD